MKTKLYLLGSLIAGLMIHSVAVQADDIDIYSGLGTGTNTPNIMLVVDNPSSQNNNVGPCTYSAAAGGGTPSQGSNALGNDQCALANIVASMIKNADGSALFKLGMTTMDGVILKLTPVDDNLFTGTPTSTAPSASYTVPAGSTNRQAILIAVKALNQSVGKSGQGTELQETWAYYTGGNGTYAGINTATGLLSGITYPGTSAASGCQKNYIIYLSNVKANAGHAQDNGELPALDAVARNALASGSITTTQIKAIDPSYSGYTGTIPSKPQAGYGIEWSRLMSNVDINSASAGLQGIVTYSVATGDTASPITNDMEKYIKAVAEYSNGQYYPAGYSSTELQNDILKILNEIQAVNSVFSSSSLPVSVNAQGTFLNQIYMGMFRPDAGALPRWAGNLKQYQFVLDPTTGGLKLGDSLGNGAISSAGTGFISPNAISFWTCTDLSGSSSNGYLSNNLTSAQITQLGTNSQNCTDLASGFWVNNTSSTNAPAKGFDLPDGELVERGGAAQQIRNTNLTDNYTTSPAAPRKLYTWCPSGSGCVGDLTNSANAFSTGNSGITGLQFGAASTLPVSSIVRTGTTALVSTGTTPHGYTTGNSVTISGATQPEYNVTQNITVNSATTFTITGLPDFPTSPSAGTYLVNLHNAITQAVSGITRSVTGTAANSVTATATFASAHGYSNGNSIQITGASPADYNGIQTIATSGPTSTTFTFSVPITPTTPAVNTYNATIHPYSRTLSSISKGGSAFTATTTAAHGFHVGQTVKISGTGIAAYDATQTIAAVPTATTFTLSGISGNPGTATTGSVAPSTTALNISTLTRSSNALSSTATATGVTASAFTNGDLLDISVNIGSAANESAYIANGVVITCSGTCTSFTYPITTTPLTPASGTMQAALSVTPLTIPASQITRSGTTATVTGVANAFTNGATVDISTSGTAYSNESAYTGTWVISCPSACSTAFTFGPVTLTPSTPATGANITSYQGSTPPAKDPLINWVRGEDNHGDEKGPGGTTTVRPSVHGDVLHSRPTVINYGSYPVTITATSDSGTTRTATAPSTEVTTISSFGAYPIVTFANGQACPVTVASSTSFTYLATSCGASGVQTAAVGSKVVVFYGDNSGVFHAVNGNQSSLFGTTRPGEELWGFIPTELFNKLNRQRTTNPQLQLPSTPPGIVPSPQAKDYFVDGATGVYQLINSSGTTTKAALFLTMRRGGNFIYALDVSDPATPTILWKVDITSTDMAELGQTWSQPKVARVKGYCGGSTCSSSNPPTPVLIFGGGYDTQEDIEPPLANTSGRAIFVLDALTGAVVWKATYATSSSCSGTTYKAACGVAGMNYGIPSDITLLDRDQDGFIDRLYAADVGGNIWRVDLQPGGNATPNFWQVNRLAALGCWTSECSIPTSTTQRKFFYPPEVITATSTHNYDSVIAGTGDREHPLYVSTSTQRYNRIVLLKDTYTGDDASGMATITFAGTNPLIDATTITTWDGTSNGYYITLAAGEKVVNAPLVTAGFVYMGTNQPSATSSTACLSNLGIAKGYQLSPFAGTLKFVEFAGGGLPPSPVSGIVNVIKNGVVVQMPFLIGAGNPDCVGADCKSALGGQKPPITVSTKRNRTYRYIENK